MNKHDKEKMLATFEFLQIFLGECSQGRLPTREDLEEMRRKLDLVEYLITPREETKTKWDIGYRVELPVCSFAGCESRASSVWNIAASKGPVEPVWRCRDHIPPELTFPISLWGEDWEATGRQDPRKKER